MLHLLCCKGCHPHWSRPVITVGPISSLTTGCWARQGEAAARIWDAIYTQSCFANIHANDTCTERRIFYRLVSGKQMQAAASLQHAHAMCGAKRDAQAQCLQDDLNI
jgi:Endoplasmic Reticulum Oxidoreductin 1 (ERO1)